MALYIRIFCINPFVVLMHFAVFLFTYEHVLCNQRQTECGRMPQLKMCLYIFFLTNEYTRTCDCLFNKSDVLDVLNYSAESAIVFIVIDVKHEKSGNM